MRCNLIHEQSNVWHCNLNNDSFYLHSRGGGHWPERGYVDVRPWRPPFHASPAVRKGPISSKRISSQDPLLRKFGNFSLCSLNFRPNFSSQAPKFGNFRLTSPQIWKFSVRNPHTSEIRAAHPYLKKSWVPPPPAGPPLPLVEVMWMSFIHKMKSCPYTVKKQLGIFLNILISKL